MDECTKKQIPLRDTYIACTEPVNPYHSNYVVVKLTKPYCLNIPATNTNLWDIQSPQWYNIGQVSPASENTYPPQWSDVSRQFLMPTHGVRTWSNGSYWWNPNYYNADYPPNLTPVSRSSKYPEALPGDTLFLRGIINGMGVLGGLYAQYSEYSIEQTTFGDSYYYGNTYDRHSFPYWASLPSEYTHLNDWVTLSAAAPGDDLNRGIPRVAGLNLTLFVVDAVVNSPPPTFGPMSSNFMTLTIKPLVPWVDLSGCYLNPPGNYSTNPLYSEQADWDGLYEVVSTNGNPFYTAMGGDKTAVLPAIQSEISARTRCFYVTLPVQLYTLCTLHAPQSGSSGFTFSLTDVSAGGPSYDDANGDNIYANMEVVATKLKGTFLDINGDPCVAQDADSIQFEIVDPLKLFTLSHTYEENTGGKNRPIYCTESGALPIRRPDSGSWKYSTSILFAPKCGPGIWTNLPSTQPPTNLAL